MWALFAVSGNCFYSIKQWGSLLFIIRWWEGQRKNLEMGVTRKQSTPNFPKKYISYPPPPAPFPSPPDTHKRLQHRIFPGNIAKFLITPLLKNICDRLLLKTLKASRYSEAMGCKLLKFVLLALMFTLRFQFFYFSFSVFDSSSSIYALTRNYF